MRDNYQPLTIGRRITIRSPEDSAPEPVSGISIILERGAFGSGEHETTRSCLELLESGLVAPGDKVLDFGSGTGLLSITALLFGAAEAYCVDIDQAAIESGRRNCLINGLSRQVNHFCGRLEELQETAFNLVLANIYSDILLASATDLTNRCAPDAYLLLSGIPWEDNFDIRSRYQQLGCKTLKNLWLEDYTTLLLQKG
ncbi:50S ribosomal protein L11 methyltransferase [Pelobacter seleniigenes]|uniref:50S ribosomal protein L11 methyltransferase n=1 Tax=Pelobacter seleniigenes TaxID=407188 RepID=UPI00068CFC89|nr:50S ribosomal protein L11 methyltransferase [Pelobacter seleniigenes]